MNVVTAEFKANAEALGIVDAPEHLSKISETHRAAMIWRRSLTDEFRSWIEAIAPAQLPSARLILRPGDVAEAIHQVFDVSGFQFGTQRIWLEADIVALANRFAGLMDAPFLRVRLDVVDTNACRRFHIDAIKARLICTYRGSGTQYGFSADGDAPAAIAQVTTGSPMIMRGTLWPTEPTAGLLHRSPPIEGTGETRFVLVIDPIFDVEDAQ